MFRGAASFQDLELSDISSWPIFIKLLATLLMGAFILFFIYKLFYIPKLNELKAEQFKEQTLKREYEEKQALAANLNEYEDQTQEVAVRLQELLGQLPNKNEVPELLADISKAGRVEGMVFKRFKPSKSKQQDFYERLPIKIEASGTYHQLAQFISTIANFQRVVTVGDFDITRSPLTGGQPDVTVPLTIKADIFTYHFNESNSGSKSAEQTRKAEVNTRG